MSPEKVRIVTDSTARVTPAEIEKYGIGVARLNINVNKNKKFFETLKDDFTTDPKDFVKKLGDKSLDILTSSPTPGEFLSIYEQSKDRPTLTMLMSSKLSKGTYEAAGSAKEYGGYNNVEIINTENVCLLRRQVLNAAILAEQGKSIQQIINQFKYSKERSVLYVALDNLDRLKKSGRVSGIQEIAAKILGKKLILEVRNDNALKYETTQGIDKAVELMENITLSLKPTEICIFHGGDEKFERMAIDVADNMRLRTGKKINVSYDYAGRLLTSHTNAQVIGIGCFTENPIPEKVSKAK